MTLLIKPNPAVTLSGLMGVCSGPATNALVTANATIPTGTITTYAWTGGIAPFNASSHSFNATGTFNVTVTASNSGSTVTPVTILPLQILVSLQLHQDLQIFARVQLPALLQLLLMLEFRCYHSCFRIPVVQPRQYRRSK